MKDLALQVEPHYLLATVTGPYTLARARAHLEHVGVVVRERKLQRVLVDITAMSGDVPDLDRYEIGKEAAEIFQSLQRLAILTGEQYRLTGFAADVASNRGLDLRNFVDRGAAVAWVTSP